jgi:hypothetical protein
VADGERDERYQEHWPSDRDEAGGREVTRDHGMARPKQLALAAFAALPWLLYFGLVFAAWWLIIFDGDAGTDGLGWALLALALPCLFVAAQVSRWQRRWIQARFELEMGARGPSKGGGPLGWLDWP